MKRILAVTGVITLALTLAACGEDDTTTDTGTTTQTSTMEESTAEETTTEEMTTEDTTTAEMAEGDIVDTAVEAGSFTTLTAALEAAGLDETLRGDGPLTVFAPTDEAFAALPEGTVDTLLADPQGDLTETLTYHVIDGEVLAADVVEMDGQSVETLQGGTLTIEVEGEQVVLVDAAGNRINVTDTDIDASNGVIHAVDAVLSPTP